MAPHYGLNCLTTDEVVVRLYLELGCRANSHIVGYSLQTVVVLQTDPLHIKVFQQGQCADPPQTICNRGSRSEREIHVEVKISHEIGLCFK